MFIELRNENRRNRLPWKQRSLDTTKILRGSDEGQKNIRHIFFVSCSTIVFDLIFLVIFKVFCADHTYTTMKMQIDTPASRIIKVSADKLGLKCDQPDDLKLCEVKSTGGSNFLL